MSAEKWSHKNPLLKDKPTKWNTLYFCLCGGLKVNNKRAFYTLVVLEERWALKKCRHKNPLLKNKNTNFVVQSKKHYTCVYVAGCGPKVNRKQSRNSISASTTSTQLMWHLISPLPQRLFWSTIKRREKSKWSSTTSCMIDFLPLRWNQDEMEA